MRKKILILIVLFFFSSTFTPPLCSGYSREEQKLLPQRPDKFPGKGAGFTQEVKLTTEVPKEFVSLIAEGKTWWQILPGYEIFLSIFGCLYFAFAVQVLLNFLKEERK